MYSQIEKMDTTKIYFKKQSIVLMQFLPEFQFHLYAKRKIEFVWNHI